MQVILLFENTRIVVNAERLLTENKISCKVLPTPLSVTKQCGMALQIEVGELPRVKQLLTESKYNFNIYEE